MSGHLRQAIIGLVALLLSFASLAGTTPAAIVVPAIEWPVVNYDAHSVCVNSDSTPSAVDAAGGTAPFFGVPTGLDTAKSGGSILENSIRGNAFEAQVREALGATKNTTPVTIPGLGTAIPDIMGVGITEIKDVLRISFARQLRIEAAATDGPLNLIVSPRNQYISGPMRQAVERSGGSIRVFDPGTGPFR